MDEQPCWINKEQSFAALSGIDANVKWQKVEREECTGFLEQLHLVGAEAGTDLEENAAQIWPSVNNLEWLHCCSAVVMAVHSVPVLWWCYTVCTYTRNWMVLVRLWSCPLKRQMPPSTSLLPNIFSCREKGCVAQNFTVVGGVRLFLYAYMYLQLGKTKHKTVSFLWMEGVTSLFLWASSAAMHHTHRPCLLPKLSEPSLWVSLLCQWTGIIGTGRFSSSLHQAKSVVPSTHQRSIAYSLSIITSELLLPRYSLLEAVFDLTRSNLTL